jgi:hypothetical protein
MGRHQEVTTAADEHGDKKEPEGIGSHRFS